MDVLSEQDKWWQRTGKNILNRKDCAKAAWAEGAKEQERRQMKHIPGGATCPVCGTCLVLLPLSGGDILESTHDRVATEWVVGCRQCGHFAGPVGRTIHEVLTELVRLAEPDDWPVANDPKQERRHLPAPAAKPEGE